VPDEQSLRVIHTGIKVLWRHAQFGFAQTRHESECENIFEYQPVSSAGVCALLNEMALTFPIVSRVRTGASSLSKDGASTISCTSASSTGGYNICGQLKLPAASTLSLALPIAASNPIRPSSAPTSPRLSGNAPKVSSEVSPLPTLAPLPPLSLGGAPSGNVVMRPSFQESKLVHPSMTTAAPAGRDRCVATGKGARTPIDRSDRPTPMPAPKLIRAGSERRCSVIITSRRVQAEHAAAAPVLHRDKELKSRSTLSPAVLEKTTGGCCPACDQAAATFQK